MHREACSIDQVSASPAWASVVLRAKKLDPTAFDEIVDAYAGRLAGFFRRMLGRQEDAEDLVQEVFVRVVRTIQDYREDGRFEAWLFRIAANLARDRIRHAGKSPRVGSLDRGEAADEESPVDRPWADESANSPESAAELADEVDRMQQALAKLPASEREVVLLRHYGHLSFAEIARFTETPLGTALSRAHRGLGKLKQWMESKP